MLATALKVCLALFTFGTNDAGVWDASALVIRDGKSRSIYFDGLHVLDAKGKFLHHQIFNHPPFMIFVLAGLNEVQDLTGTPAHVSIRLLDSLADAGTLALTAAIVTSLAGSVPLWPFALIALAPAWIFISGFHANSDPLMLFFLILTVYLVEVRRFNLLAAIAFAMATGIKIVPLLLLPAFLLYLDRRNRAKAVAILGFFWAVTATPWVLYTSQSFMHMIFGYRSITGWWGFGWLLSKIPALHYLSTAFNTFGVCLLFGAMGFVTWLLNRGSSRTSLFYQFGILLFVFMFLTPGFGIQYLAWLAPWILLLPWGVIAAHIAMSGLFCGTTYTYWTRGLPWYFANPISGGPWTNLGALANLVATAGVLAWVTTALVLQAYYRGLSLRHQIGKQPKDVRKSSPLSQLSS